MSTQRNSVYRTQLYRTAMRSTWLFFVALILLGWHASLHAQAPFYQGKTIRLIIGSTAGGGYDLWARHAARYWANIFRVVQKSSHRTCLEPAA